MRHLHKWANKTIAEIAAVGGGSGFPNAYQGQSSGDYPFIKVSDLNLPGNERLVVNANHWVSEIVRKKLKAKVFPVNTVVFAKVGGALLTNKRRILTRDTIIDNNMMALTPSAIHAKYLYQTLLTIDLSRYSQEGAVPSINGARVGAIVIDLPPLPEQQKIAEILGKWDESLEKLGALIAAKLHRKQALKQQLLTGHRRLLGFTKPWSKVQLSDVAEECSERNRELLDRTRLYAVTKANGMVPMRENVQGKTINRCLLVEQDWFAYNPMRINIGSIARWEGESPVMVSPDYVVFRTNKSHLLSDYLNHLRRGSEWAYFVGAAGNGSVRVRIWFDDLGCFKFLLPPVDEQRAIADILDTADTELRLLRQQREALDQQKRGLMQQLLTGKVRVTV